MKKPLLITALLLISVFCNAQTLNLSLQECYKLAEQNYPLIKRYDLISKTKDYTIENLQKGYLPQASFSAQATYQSAVTEIPIQLPGVDIPTISKDQYKAYVQLDQMIYDGGTIKSQKQIAESNAMTSQQQLAADLYQLRGRINQLFFGVLLVENS